MLRDADSVRGEAHEGADLLRAEPLGPRRTTWAIRGGSRSSSRSAASTSERAIACCSGPARARPAGSSSTALNGVRAYGAGRQHLVGGDGVHEGRERGAVVLVAGQHVDHGEADLLGHVLGHLGCRRCSVHERGPACSGAPPRRDGR